MPATADELRFELAAKIARPVLLDAREHFCPLIEQGKPVGITCWRRIYLDECDAALDEALDATDVAILAHA